MSKIHKGFTSPKHQVLRDPILTESNRPNTFEDRRNCPEFWPHGHPPSREGPLLISSDKQPESPHRFSRFEPWHLTEMLGEIRRDKDRQKENIIESDDMDEDSSSYGIFDRRQHVAGKMPTPNTAELKVKPKEKGLRKLSNKAFEIVKDLGEVTYKQVAVKLIKEIQMDESDAEADDEKEESNIKRRVYDALNVLIAMGMLEKRSRSIIYVQRPEILGYSGEAQAEKVRLDNDMKNRIRAISGKKQKIRLLSLRREYLARLVDRNKCISQTAGDRINLPVRGILVSPGSVVTAALTQQSIVESKNTQEILQYIGTKNVILNQFQLIEKLPGLLDSKS